MKFYIISDFREDFPDLGNGERYYNDHPKKDSIMEICVLLNEVGYECEYYGGVDKLIQVYYEKSSLPEGIFINMSDGRTERYSRIQVPILADLLNLAYSGCDPFLVGLMSNKYYSNCAVEKLNINVPKCILFDNLYSLENCSMTKGLSFPLIIKPNTEGSSLGITDRSLCYNFEELISEYNNMIMKHKDILVQEYIDGYEVTNLIVGNPGNYILNEVIITMKNNSIYYENNILTQNDKANKLTKDVIADDYLPSYVITNIKEITKTIFEGLHLRDITRIDYRITKNYDIFFIELNSAPRISSTSEISLMCNHANITFTEFLCKYCDIIQTRINHEKA